MFESLDDGLVSKPVTPRAVTKSAAFALRIVTGEIRDILLRGFVRSPHRHDPGASSRFPPASWEHPARELLLAALPWR
jgi:hypothetical protein